MPDAKSHLSIVNLLLRLFCFVLLYYSYYTANEVNVASLSALRVRPSEMMYVDVKRKWHYIDARQYFL